MVAKRRSVSDDRSECAKRKTRAEVGLFPPPVKISRYAVGWPAHEVTAIVAARIAGRRPDEIRALVKELVAARATIKPNINIQILRLEDVQEKTGLSRSTVYEQIGRKATGECNATNRPR